MTAGDDSTPASAPRAAPPGADRSLYALYTTVWRLCSEPGRADCDELVGDVAFTRVTGRTRRPTAGAVGRAARRLRCWSRHARDATSAVALAGVTPAERPSELDRALAHLLRGSTVYHRSRCLEEEALR